MKVEKMTVVQLVDQFAANCIDQYHALERFDVQKFNRLYPKMSAISEELQKRPGDQRRALVNLYSHPNSQVRLQAARVSFALAPEAARTVIEVIANSRTFPQAGDAGMTLFNLDSGIFKPT